MQAQALYKLVIVDAPWYCGQPGQLKCLQMGKLLKVLQRELSSDLPVQDR